MEKQRWEESERRREEERRSEKTKSEKKEDAGARKGIGKSRLTVFFEKLVAPEGQKVGSRKRRGLQFHRCSPPQPRCFPFPCHSRWAPQDGQLGPIQVLGHRGSGRGGAP